MKIILNKKPLGFPWETGNPFLFCVHHKDAYPRGNEEMGPDASLQGRNLGNDFTLKDGWRMYHGDRIPGFPSHPHRGFETITVVERGFVDHADSAGAAGRYGEGDVQWMTAGKGLQHSEMFPLLKRDSDNPLELFQIWLNLPKASKFAEPHFAMHWHEKIPVAGFSDEQGRKTNIKLVSGSLGGTSALPPAPDSWAADPSHEVIIALINMDPEAYWELPAASKDLNRSLFFYEGDTTDISGQTLKSGYSIALRSDLPVSLQNGSGHARFLLLQGKPIDEPVVQYGPFVMNTKQEIQQAMMDFNETRFGGWPWPRHDMVHPGEKGRFARYADGMVETPPRTP